MIQDGRVEVGEGERLVPGPSLSYSSEPCSEGMSAYEQVMSEETGFDAVSAQQCSVDIVWVLYPLTHYSWLCTVVWQVTRAFPRTL